MDKKEMVKAVEDTLKVLVVPRLDRIESKQAEHDEKFREFLIHFDKIYKKIERLEQEYYIRNPKSEIPGPPGRAGWPGRRAGRMSELKKALTFLQGWL